MDQPNSYADTLHGRYWLKKEFSVGINLKTPALVLGLIADQHRAYLMENLLAVLII